MAYTTIDKPTDYFNTVLYSGNGSTNTITGVGHQPDFTWLKCRSNLEGHELYDSVRGVTKMLTSNGTSAESTQSTALTSFDSDGFTLGSDFEVNASGRTFVSWNWLGANASSSNTDGSITSTVSANTTAGFSIVSYTGTGNLATVGHGLGVAPDAILCKSVDSAQNWASYWSPFGGTKYMRFNTDGAVQTNAGRFGNTDATSSVFTVNIDGEVNTSGGEHIAYCFSSIKGFSKIGTYTGNGNADGTFVYTGFKPSFLMVKRTDTSGNPWIINDNKRDPFNFCRKNLFANASDAEVDVTSESGTWDLLSNGVKMRNSGTSLNGSGSTYIYMAFAENPFVTSTGIPTTAR